MKQIFFVVLFVTFSMQFVQAQQIIDLWSADHPASHVSPLTGSETKPDDAGRISNISHPTITVFSPMKTNNTGRAVIICPGGGYWLLTTYDEGSDFARMLAKNGVTGIVLKSRMPGRVHQIPLEDADRAMELTIQNADKWKIDTSKIGVMGFSAGGHLAAMMATRGAVRPRFAVLFYPVISMREGITHEGSRDQLIGSAPLREYYSAELAADKRTPATLLFHSTDDTAVSIANSYLFQSALRRLRIPCELVTYPTGGHGWGYAKDKDFGAAMRVKLIEWIDGI